MNAFINRLRWRAPVGAPLLTCSAEQQRLTRRISYLLGAIILAALLLLALLSFLPGYVAASMQRISRTVLTEAAEHKALLIDQRIELHKAQFQSLTSLPKVRRAFTSRGMPQGAEALQEVNTLLCSLVAGMGDEVHSMFLVGLDGRSFGGVLRDGNPEPYKNVDFSYFPYITEALRTKLPLVSDPYRSLVSGDHIIVLEVPVNDASGQFLGLLCGALRTRFFGDLLQSEHRDEAGETFAIDRKGWLLSHPDRARCFSDEMLRSEGAQLLLRRMMAGARGLEEYVGLEGQRKLAAFASVPSCGWSVAAGMTIDEFTQASRRMRWILVGLLAMVAMLALGVGWTLFLSVRRFQLAMMEIHSSERKIAEQASLLEQTSDAIVVMDLAGRIDYWNAAAVQALGWSPQEVKTMSFRELLCIDRTVHESALTAVTGRGSWYGRVRMSAKAGQVVVMDCRWTLLSDEFKVPYAILIAGTDITLRVASEEHMLQAERLESLGTLAGGIAHDLNNLLSPIMMGANLLKSSHQSETDVEVVQIIENSAAQGAKLVKQILTFAKGVKGSVVPVHMGFVIRELSGILQATFPKDISLDVVVGDELHLVEADPSQLSQVLLNLCINSRDAMPLGGRIRVSASNASLDSAFVSICTGLTEGPHVCVEVSDTGTGIPPEVLPRIFDPFFSTKGATKGTGLGLSTVLGIVKSCRGEIKVYSDPGHGTTFRIYFPAAVSGEHARTDSLPERPELVGNGRVVLLVDDEEAIRKLGGQLLRSCGFKVFEAASGVEAYELLSMGKGAFDFLITDMMMPGMDGPTLIAKVRDLHPGISILGMSGLGGSSFFTDSTDSHIRILSKPFTANELLTTIKALC